MAHGCENSATSGSRTFTVIIEETVAQEFQVEAPNAEAAAETARELYRTGELVLCPGELQSARICVASEGELGVWEDV